MNATPRHRSQQAEREELARLLPAAAAPEPSLDRHLLLKEHLMDSVTENSRRAAKRRTLTLRLALPVGLAAAVAGVALTAVTGRPAAPTPGVSAGGSKSLGGITNAAYTLESSSDDLVKLTILDPAKEVDVPQLQRDLDRLGARAHVYAGEPDCHAPEPKSPSYPPDPAALKADRVSYYGWNIDDEGRKSVLTIRPSGIPADLQLYIYLPYAKTDPANGSAELEAGLMKSPAPSCMPSKIFTNPLASLFPTPTH